MFTQTASLKSHIQSKHKSIKFQCQQCEIKFTQKASLKSHIQSKHEGMKFQCQQCDHEYTYKSDLKKHKQSRHEGIIFNAFTVIIKEKIENISRCIQRQNINISMPIL